MCWSIGKTYIFVFFLFLFLFLFFFFLSSHTLLLLFVCLFFFGFYLFFGFSFFISFTNWKQMLSPWSVKSYLFRCNTKRKQEILRAVTITIICSTLASLWKFQYFQRPVYNSVEYLWRSFYCKNSKLFSIFTKSSILDARLGSKYVSAFRRLLKRFISLKYFTL